MPDVPRVLLLDPGAARIGVAVSDELGALAHPRPAVPAKDLGRALRALRAIVDEEQISHVLIGLPVSLSGVEGEAARRARRFAARVADALGREVELIDERLSTAQAKRELAQAGVSTRHQREKIDGVAACLLLQAWLDGRRSRG
ncbi:MAG: Holliday junction resolvase RuvX [Polyangiaceae bacterium]|nr:Holliday junction resolvase RuvX [Polyangiaceae bacterium]